MLVISGDVAPRPPSYRRDIDRKGGWTMQREHHEIVIVGGGQAGLSVAYHLKKQGRSFVVLDGSERIGDSWRNRWDTLELYSPAFKDGLPGMPFPAKPTTCPTKDEMADYLEAYAARFELPVRGATVVDAVARESGGYVVNAGERSFQADRLVVATGVFQKPYTPTFAGELDPGIVQLHSSDYRNLSQLQPGPVLVVGASHSGSDIAHEAAAEHAVVLSGRDTGQLPFPLESRRGRTGFRALVLVGTHLLTVDTPPGRKMRAHVRHGGAPLLRYRKKDLAAAHVDRVLARTVGVKNGLPVLDDGRVLDVRNVVWCTGFRPDYGWLRFPLELGDDGFPVQYKGVAASSPGLYFVGLPFLHSFASMLVAGAAREAGWIARHLEAERAGGRASGRDELEISVAS
jgi:putative flavoprotein involved in K+ transport